MSATMSHNMCKYLSRRQPVFTDLRVRLAEENILLANDPMCFYSLSGGVAGNVLGFNPLMKACTIKLSGKGC